VSGEVDREADGDDEQDHHVDVQVEVPQLQGTHDVNLRRYDIDIRCKNTGFNEIIQTKTRTELELRYLHILNYLFSSRFFYLTSSPLILKCFAK